MIERVIAAGLAFALLVSALQLVVARHESRRLFVELQELELIHDRLNEDWGRLQLEEATWGTHGRVEQLTRDRLAMIQPEGDDIVLLEP